MISALHGDSQAVGYVMAAVLVIGVIAFVVGVGILTKPGRKR